MKIACPHCSQHIDFDPPSCGRFISCPTCSGLLDIPTHGLDSTIAQAVSQGAKFRSQPLRRIARGAFMFVGAILLFLFSKIVATAIVGSTINERVKSRAAVATGERKVTPPAVTPQLESDLGVRGQERPRSWPEIEKDPAYQALTWVDKLKVLDRWVERVLQYGRSKAVSSTDSNFASGAAEVRTFRAQKAKEISAAAHSSPK